MPHIYAAPSLPPRLAVQLERSSLESPHCDTAPRWGELDISYAKVTTAGIAGLEEIGTLECLDGIGK
jgi:hypothetical protein